MSDDARFDFGSNWVSLANRALDQKRILEAEADFTRLLDGVELGEREFLDIGFGQGLALLLAKRKGARAIGVDVNSNCAIALEKTASLVGVPPPEVIIGSILDQATVDRIRRATQDGKFDVVHSWGVLHHTGDMYRSLSTAVELVRPGGYLVIAIYNHHWTSWIWKAIKKTYVNSPPIIQKVLVAVFLPVIWLAKFMVTGRWPSKQERGMDFYHDVVDWVGGYPYEYASADRIRQFVEENGLTFLRGIAAYVPTGCNQFVFQSRKN